MPFPKANISYPGLVDFETATYVMTLGISPNTVMIETRPEIKLPSSFGDLEFTAGNGRIIRLRRCRLASVQAEMTQDGPRWIIAIQDRRWSWSLGEISGRYNVRKPDLENMRVLDPAERIEIGTERTLKQLVDLCLEAMGERNALVPSLPKEPRPQVDWIAENPAQALASLVEPYGFMVGLRLSDDRLIIVKRGQGAELPSGGIMHDSLSADYQIIPYSVKAICGPSRYQADVLLEPVGQEMNGKIKKIDQLSYKPSSGWGAEAVGFYGNVRDPTGQQKHESYQNLAKANIWKKFRIHDKPLGVDGKPLKIPGYSGKINHRRDLLPLADTQIVTRIDNQTRVESYLPAKLWGAWWNGKHLVEANTYTLKEGQSTPPPAGLNKVEWTRGFSINGEEGMIETTNACFYRNPDGTVRAPVIALRVGVTLRDPETGAVKRHIREKFTDQESNRVQTPPRVIRLDDVYGIFRPEYSPGNNDQVIGGSYEDNTEELNRYLDDYLENYIKSLKTPNPQTKQYTDLVGVDLDGAIQSVTWMLGEQGPMTTVTRNNEQHFYSIGYSERRFYEKLNRNNLAMMDRVVRAVNGELGEPFSKLSKLFGPRGV